jgi:hypothetical protein
MRHSPGDNFFRREPAISRKMASGIVPRRIEHELKAFMNRLKRARSLQFGQGNQRCSRLIWAGWERFRSRRLR